MLLHDKERQITILEEKVRRLRGSDGQDEIPMSPVIYSFFAKIGRLPHVTFSILTFKFTISLFLYFDEIWSNHQYIQGINRCSSVSVSSACCWYQSCKLLISLLHKSLATFRACGYCNYGDIGYLIYGLKIINLLNVQLIYRTMAYIQICVFLLYYYVLVSEREKIIN